VRLIDFGIAASAAAEHSTGPCFGSPGHMPPEQHSSGPLTPAADVFAVAVLLIEAWTGRAPFRRESFEASRRAFGEPRPPLADSHPSLAALEPLIAAALSAAPGDRPQTAEEFARPLREFLRQEDLGDIARRLGQRVSDRVARQAAASQRHSAAASPGAPVTSGSGATLTFAARDALLEWTARIESIPPPLATPSGLSEIESGLTAPKAPRAASGERRSARRRGLLAAVLAGTALLALPFGARVFRAEPAPPSAPLLGLAAVAPESPGAAHRDERMMDAASAAASPPAPSPADLSLAAPSPRAAPSVVPSPAAPPPAVPPPAAPPATPSPPPAAPSATPAKTASPSRPMRGADAAASAPAARARLQLTSEPAAWVEIDAVRVGRTPLLELGVSPGNHAITFVNQLLGERLEANVTLGARGAARVHADFTSASPQVYVR